MEPSKYKIAYPYVRVSTSKQENSPEVQQEKLSDYYHKFLAPEGYLWADIYQDVVSGSKAFEKREAGSAICQRAQAGDVILVTKFDRAFRSSKDFHNQISHWRKKGCRFIVIDAAVDCTTANGYFVASILVANAQLERELISERTRDSAQFCKAHGRNYCRNPQRGLRNGKDGYLEVDPYFEQDCRDVIRLRDDERLTWAEVALAFSNIQLAREGKPLIRSIAHDDCVSDRHVRRHYRDGKAMLAKAEVQAV